MEKKAKKTTSKKVAKQIEVTTKKKVSKTWLAALANRGTGKIIDMRAVLK